METGYTLKEGKHTSLLEDGFMPVEKTAHEVPVQEQFKRKIVQGNLSEVKIFCIETN